MVTLSTKLVHNTNTVQTISTVFPRIVSVETILFWVWPYVLWPLVTIHISAETIQGRKLFKGGNYSRKYGIHLLKKFCQSFVFWLLMLITAVRPKRKCDSLYYLAMLSPHRISISVWYSTSNMNPICSNEALTYFYRLHRTHF